MAVPPGLEIALREMFVSDDEVGEPGGVAGLGEDGKVPASQLPEGLPSATLWGGITGTLANQADLQGELDAKIDVSQRGVAGGVATLDGAGVLEASQLPSGLPSNVVWGGIGGSIGSQTDLQTALGLLIPLSQKAAANGVATLDSGGLIPTAQIPSGLPSSVAWGAITGTLSTQTDLNSALVGKLSTTLKGAAGGLAELDGSGKVPAAQLPSLSAVWGGITGTLASQTDLNTALGLRVLNSEKGAINGVATLGSDGILTLAQRPASAVVSWGGIVGTLSNQADLLSALNGKVSTGLLGAVSGVATLGTDGRLSTAQRPPIAWGDISGTLSAQTDLNTAINARIPTSQKAAANGVASLDANTKVPLAQLPTGNNALLVLDGSGLVPLANMPDTGEFATVLTANGTLTTTVTVVRGGTVFTLPTISGTSDRNRMVINETTNSITVNAASGQTVKGVASATVPAASAMSFFAESAGTPNRWARVPVA